MSDIMGFGLNRLRDFAYEMAASKGFWEGDNHNIGEKIALMHTELSEAMEEHRKGHAPDLTYYNTEKPGKPEGIPPELADVIIRIADFCGHYGIDLEGAVTEKMAYNHRRGHKHGKVC